LFPVNRRRLWFIAAQSALVAAAIVIAAAASAGAAARFLTSDQAAFAIAGALLISVVGAARTGSFRLMRRVGLRERLLVIGSTDADVSLARELVDKQPQLGID